MPDVEWDDPAGSATGPDETLAGQHERPRLRDRMSPTTRTALAAVAALVLVPVIGVAGVRVVHEFDDPRGSAAPPSASTSPTASPSRSLVRIPPPDRALALQENLAVVQTAISQAFGLATVQMMPSYVAGTQVSYVATVGQRRVLIVVDRDVTRPDTIDRTQRSIRIAQRVLDRRVDVTVTRPDGPTSARDYEAAVALVRDTRLLRGA
ncbi:hypothetical protein [Jatrophihabitans fulvus]